MPERHVVIYDTANILHRIRNKDIGFDNILFPLIFSYVDIVVGLMPVIKRDLSGIPNYISYVEELEKNLKENVILKSLIDLLRKGGLREISMIPDIKIAIKNLSWRRGDGEYLAGIGKERGTQRLFLFIKEEEDLPQIEYSISRLNNIIKLLSKECNANDALKDLEMYIIPFINLFKEAKYSVEIVSDDACFTKLAKLCLENEGIHITITDTASLKKISEYLRKKKREEE
jgi:hypothetical protein